MRQAVALCGTECSRSPTCCTCLHRDQSKLEAVSSTAHHHHSLVVGPEFLGSIHHLANGHTLDIIGAQLAIWPAPPRATVTSRVGVTLIQCQIDTGPCCLPFGTLNSTVTGGTVVAMRC